MQQPFFSIIMPVYNVEKYLERAVKSVLNQTYGELEIILVDDKSTDDSLKICKKLKTTDARIIIICLPQNGGICRARNAGIENARGKYIAFVDGDDYIESDLFEKVKSSLVKHDADIVVFGIIEHYRDNNGYCGENKIILPGKNFFHASKEQARETVLTLQKNTLFRYACNKVYKKQIVQDNEIYFRDFNISGDVDFNIRVFEKINSLLFLNFAGYHYEHRYSSSITSMYVPDYFAIHMGLLKDRYRQFTKWNKQKEATPYLAEEFLKYSFLSLQMSYSPKCENRKEKQNAMLEQIYSNYFYQVSNSHKIKFGIKYILLAKVLQTKNKLAIMTTARIIYVIKNKLIVLWIKIK